MSESLAVVLSNLKACVISTKDGIPLNKLDDDYTTLNGARVPFKELGFSSIEELLNSTGNFTIQNRRGVKIVQILSNKKTQHLTELISKQKSKPPKKNPYMGNKFAPRKYNNSNSHNKSINYSKAGVNTLSNYSTNRSRSYDQNSYNKTLQNDLYTNGKNYVQSVPTTNGIHPLNINGKSDPKLDQKLPLTSSCSSLESTYSSSSTGYTSKSTTLNSPDKFQKLNVMNIPVPQTVHINDKKKVSKYTNMAEKDSEFKPLTQQHLPIAKIPTKQNMPVQLSTAQSRLNKYPKKCDESVYKNDGKEKKSQTEELSVLTQDLKIEVEEPYLEVIDNQDYINELEVYLKNLNLSEPCYEFMIKKEKSGRIIKHIHICTIKVNDKSISSSFPIECSSVDNAKIVAAKHALLVLKKQYGESVIYPITNDINTMASRIKELLKVGYEESGIMGDVLERLYREKFQENLPDNWIQLLEVYSYFTFDKLVANKIIIYLNEIENQQHNGVNGHLDKPVIEEKIVPGTSLRFENYDEKCVLVSANYGTTDIWIRFVGQSADENFIKMQAEFNDIMNTSGFSIAEDIILGDYYAVLYNSSWHRVQVSYCNEEDASCFLVDTGEQLWVSRDQICFLEPIFMQTKTQAIECVLTQLDNFGTFEGLKLILDEIILNKTFFLIPDSLEDVPRVTLYEKGEGSSDRVNVNNLIIQKFLAKSVARLPSFEENAVVDAIVSSVVESGHLYLQLNFDIVSSLEEILPNDESLLPEFFLKSKEDLQIGQIYLIKYDDTLWSRVEILEIINDSEVKIIYIDYGNIGTCEITKLANLELFDPLMTKIAPQAIKASMHLLPPSMMTRDIAKTIYDIIGEDKVLVNLINASSDGVPCVQLYKTQPDTPEIPLCINVQLAQSLKKH
ncbi:tudor domain-containing protein 7-like isoform X2 [Sipha flava]|uniref:Tudor domain-containing protein 7-like isoform X2 n=1 Tax=Sipha flava TaxID=143950 RepID=A0A8B8FPZ8_9HEMI|nr:tudor domain-containing protein 7-like isoform X2 [Sipha flava]